MRRFPDRFATAFLVLVFFAATLSAADTGSLTGRVFLGEEKLTIPGVTVSLVGTPMRTATDRNGAFEFRGLAEGTYDIEASCIGYKKERHLGARVSGAGPTEVTLSLTASVFRLNEVVVTGSLQKHLLKDTPVITEVISQEDIASVGSSDLADVMRVQTGIELGTSIGQTQSVRLHGLNKNQVLVLVDGERITGRVDDAVDIGQIAVNMIEKIEVVKGPLSSIYGSEALGGVINIITKSPQHAPALHAGATYGTYGRRDFELSAARTFDGVFGGDRGLTLFANAGWNTFGGVDYNTRDAFSEMPEYDRRNLNLKISAPVTEKFSLSLKADLYKDESRWLAGGDGYINYIDRGSNEKTSATASANYIFSPSLDANVSAFYSANTHGSTEETNFGYTVRSGDTDEEIQTYRAVVTTTPYGSSVLSLGLESTIEAVTSNRLSDGARRFVNNIAFAEDEWTFSAVTVVVGGRYSDNSVYGTFFAPRVSLRWRISDNATLRSSYGRGFRAPSSNELFIDYDNAGVGYIVKGAPSLRPETSDGFNAGIDYSREDLVWFRANVYYNDVVNLINYFQVSAVGARPVVYSYHNVSSAVTKGVDVDVDLRPWNKTTISLGYNYSAAKDGNGLDLPFRSPHTLNARLAYEITEWDLNATVRGRWYDRKVVVDEQITVSEVGKGNRFYADAYAVMDLVLTKRFFRDLTLTCGINNLTDWISYPYGQTKEREFFAGLSYTLQ